MTRFVTLAEFWNVYDAAIAASALENAGIPAINTDWHIFNLYPHLMVATTGPRLLVPEAELEHGKVILLDGHENVEPVYPCPKCKGRTYRMRRWLVIIALLWFVWGTGLYSAYGPLPFFKRKRFCWSCYHQHLPAPVEPFTQEELGYAP